MPADETATAALSPGRFPIRATSFHGISRENGRTRNFSAKLALFSGCKAATNIASVEVRKRPQGTLWGRTATAGAILINTKAPSKVLTGDFEVGYSF